MGNNGKIIKYYNSTIMYTTSSYMNNVSHHKFNSKIIKIWCAKHSNTMCKYRKFYRIYIYIYIENAYNI